MVQDKQFKEVNGWSLDGDKWGLFVVNGVHVLTIILECLQFEFSEIVPQDLLRMQYFTRSIWSAAVGGQVGIDFLPSLPFVQLDTVAVIVESMLFGKGFELFAQLFLHFWLSEYN